MSKKSAAPDVQELHHVIHSIRTAQKAIERARDFTSYGWDEDSTLLQADGLLDKVMQSLGARHGISTGA